MFDERALMNFCLFATSEENKNCYFKFSSMKRKEKNLAIPFTNIIASS